MQQILVWFARIFISQFIVRALAGAGLALITYQGLSGYIEGFLSAWADSVSGLPSDMVALLMMAGVGEAIDIIGSAMLSIAAIRLAMQTVKVGVAV